MGGEVKFTDRSGQPRTDEEVLEAIRVVGNRIVTAFRAETGQDPELFMQFPVIREALKELLATRAALRGKLKEMMKRADDDACEGERDG